MSMNSTSITWASSGRWAAKLGGALKTGLHRHPVPRHDLGPERAGLLTGVRWSARNGLSGGGRHSRVGLRDLAAFRSVRFAGNVGQDLVDRGPQPAAADVVDCKAAIKSAATTCSLRLPCWLCQDN